ncbi:MAG: hypothetical protein JWR21_1697 [Herminiimonas sp.]|nr:hypothetical protein [Herminiimonas sp.]
MKIAAKRGAPDTAQVSAVVREPEPSAVAPESEPASKPATSPRGLVERTGSMYSKQLGIKIATGEPGETFKWFLAALLFGARISESVAMRTWREFEKAELLTPKKIVEAGWDRLVKVLDGGGYARYDFKTATKLLDVCGALQDRYKGDLNALHAEASDEANFEGRLRELGKGIGDLTANIFLREMRGTWSKAAPLPSPRVIEAAHELGYVPRTMRTADSVMRRLQAAWRKDGGSPENFPEFEAALVRFGGQRRKPSTALKGTGTKGLALATTPGKRRGVDPK